MPKSHYAQGQSPQPGRRSRLGLEVLEDRTVLSTTSSPVISLQGLAVSSSYSQTDILVQFRPGATAHALTGTTLGTAVSKAAGLYEIDLKPGTTVANAINLFRADPTVLKAEPDYLLTVSSTPNDPQFSQQWDMKNTGQAGGTAGADINVTSAWNVTKGSPQIIVAVLDTGIDYTHQDLYDNIWINQKEIPQSRLKNLVDYYHDGFISMRDLNDPRNQGVGKITDLNHNGHIDAGDLLTPMSKNGQGQDTGNGGWADGISEDGSGYLDDIVGWNFFANNNNPMDDFGHGTHVAGTIGAMGNNSVGISGIDPNVTLMDVKFLGTGGGGTVSQFIEALNYSVINGARISNNSWSGAAYSTILADAIDNARVHGQIFVAAAGNYGTDNDVQPAYPASFQLDNVVSVAATDRNNALASFSDYGKTSVDLGAPGVDILSTLPGNTYGYYSGTSQATPHVAGVLALVWSEHPGWTYKQVITQVLSTVEKIPSLAGKTTTGGLLDAAAAVGGASVASVSTLSIVDSTATGPNATSLNKITVKFDHAINPATFTAADVFLVGADGSVISVTGVQAVAGSGNLSFTLTFATQTKSGYYKVKIGPNVQDASGTLMTVFNASYYLKPATTTTPPPVVTTPLAVVDSTATGPNATSLNKITVKFNRAVNVSTFTAADVFLVGADGTVINVTGVQAVAGSGNLSFDLTFATQTKSGYYKVKIGPDVADAAGTKMTVFNASYYLKPATTTTPPPVVTTPLAVVDSTATGPNATSLNKITVKFNRAVNVSTFTAADVFLVGADGTVINVTGVQAVAGSGNLSFDLTFATQTKSGYYKVKIGPDVADAAGTKMTVFNSSYYLKPATTTPPPPVTTPLTIVDSKATGPNATSLNKITVKFARAVNVSTFTAADVFLVGADGSVIAVTGVQAVAGSGNLSFDLTFSTQTKSGYYKVKIGPNVQDASGTPMTVFNASYYLAPPASATPTPTGTAGSGVFVSSTPVNVPTGGRGVSFLTVASNITIKTVKIEINLTHPNVGDLYIHVQGPDGTNIVLANRKGGPTSNMIGTIFDDNASLPIAFGRGPFTGSYQPDSSLSNLAGKSTLGVWKLWVEDSVGSSQGVLSSWSVIVNE